MDFQLRPGDQHKGRTPGCLGYTTPGHKIKYWISPSHWRFECHYRLAELQRKASIDKFTCLDELHQNSPKTFQGAQLFPYFSRIKQRGWSSFQDCALKNSNPDYIQPLVEWQWGPLPYFQHILSSFSLLDSASSFINFYFHQHFLMQPLCHSFFCFNTFSCFSVRYLLSLFV